MQGEGDLACASRGSHPFDRYVVAVVQRDEGVGQMIGFINRTSHNLQVQIIISRRRITAMGGLALRSRSLYAPNYHCPYHPRLVWIRSPLYVWQHAERAGPLW